ncbi:hypothetical protein [Actinomadura sp. 9N407]|uniref:hypothetical protein n=1 Tax=Actinomadura sp. 9N407 TaxID=3375154 RepID=UPI00379FFCB9
MLTATILACVLTAGVGAVLCLPRFWRRAPGAGAGLIAGWLVPTLLTGGALTGVKAELYEPMNDGDAWANGTTRTEAASLARRIDTALVDALSGAPGPVADIRLARRVSRADSNDRLGAEGTIIVGQGKAEGYRRTLASRLATRYPSLKADTGKSRFKVSEDIALEVTSGREGWSLDVGIGTPHVADQATALPREAERDERTIRRVGEMTRALGLGSALGIQEEPVIIPCPGSRGQARVYGPTGEDRWHSMGVLALAGTRTFTLPEGGQGTVFSLQSGRHEGMLVARAGGLDVQLSAGGSVLGVFQGCPR